MRANNSSSKGELRSSLDAELGAVGRRPLGLLAPPSGRLCLCRRNAAATGKNSAPGKI